MVKHLSSCGRVTPVRSTASQGEGREQGDALMPLLFSLGQHGVLQDVSRRLGRGELLFAFLDDTYIVSKPTRWRRSTGSNPCGQDSNLEPSRHQT